MNAEAAQQRVGGVACAGSRPARAASSSRAGSALKSPRRNGPWASDQRPVRTTRRDSTSSRAGERDECLAREEAGEARHAPRTSSASLCQCTRRNARGVQSSEQAASGGDRHRRRSESGRHLRLRSTLSRVRALTWPRARKCGLTHVNAGASNPAASPSDEHLRQYRRHALLQTLRRQQRADRGVARSRSCICTAGTPGIFPKIEEALTQEADRRSISVTLEPEDAFGEYDAELVRIETADRPSARREGGDAVRGGPGQGDEGRIVFTSPTSPTARPSSTAITSWPDSGCASIARFSTCAPRRRRRSRTGTFMAPHGHHH